MPLICYGCGKKISIITKGCGECCTFYYEERDIGYAECLNAEAQERLTEEELDLIASGLKKCPYYEEATIGDICDGCLEASRAEVECTYGPI